MARFSFYRRMTDGPRVTPGRDAEQAARAVRRARALRENLRRRKEQARARMKRAAEPSGSSSEGDEPSLEERLRLA